MLNTGTVTQVLQMLASGQLSQRKIARAIGISRATVSAIAHGRRQEDPPDRPGLPTETAALRWNGPAKRCPGCGGLVYTPCRLCAARAAAARLPEHRRPSDGLLEDRQSHQRHRADRQPDTRPQRTTANNSEVRPLRIIGASGDSRAIELRHPPGAIKADISCQTANLADRA